MAPDSLVVAALIDAWRLANDYYVGLVRVRVREQLEEQYASLAPDYRAVLDGHARGINLYAYHHPHEADGRLYALSGRDIAAGFAHKVRRATVIAARRRPSPRVRRLPGIECPCRYSD